MHPQIFPPDWLADTPLQVPLTYFSSLRPSGSCICNEPGCVLYGYANQLFGWGAFPTESLKLELKKLTGSSRIWLLAPPDWEKPLAELSVHSSVTVIDVIHLHHIQRQSPKEPVVLPSGFYCSPLIEYSDDVGSLFTLFEQEQGLAVSEVKPQQQFDAVNTHGQCWGLFREQQIVGKLDILYPTGECAWGGGLLLLPELRGSRLGGTFLLHLLQQSSYSRFEIQVSSELLTYYQNIGCSLLSRFCWYHISG